MSESGRRGGRSEKNIGDAIVVFFFGEGIVGVEAFEVGGSGGGGGAREVKVEEEEKREEGEGVPAAAASWEEEGGGGLQPVERRRGSLLRHGNPRKEREESQRLQYSG